MTCHMHVHVQVTWYSYPKYRLWRKNVRPSEGSKCAGVDLNRNFDTHWDMVRHYYKYPNACTNFSLSSP